ncbi:hypothetical protein [Kluyvera ascorbata]|uniref:hypothetical protein n=1 Tax=Kluyvera ascorbata TaxID=51288 RepID=UPI0039F6A084
MINKILELYARCGESLVTHGLMEAVLPIHMVNDALDLFVNSGWIVSGGDVYQYNNGVMVNFYADWFCGTMDCVESCDYAKAHLSNLSGGNLFVSFVIKD